MNWLIIESKKQQKTCESAPIEKILVEHEIHYKVISIDDIEKFGNDPAKFDVIKSFTHVIILDETFGQNFHGNLLGFGTQFLLLGVFSGNQIPVYGVNFMHLPLLDKIVKSFSNCNELAAYIQENFKLIQRENLRKDSVADLLGKGIPVTSECFAQYIKKNNIDICKKLRLAGVDVNSTDVDGTPLLNVAVRNENLEIVKWLLKHGANINTISADRGYSPVMDAVWKSNEEIVEYLIAHNANLDFISKEGQSILVLAVGIGKLNTCKVLAENGADPDVKDSMGMSAYEYAVLFHRDEIANVLKPFHKEL